MTKAKHEEATDRKLSAPSKITIFFGAVGTGAEARRYYDDPMRYGLVGEDTKDMLSRVAQCFGYPGGGEALDRKISEHLGVPMEDWD